MRMSSGASVAYEKPRSGRSTCIDDSEVEQDRVGLDAVCGELREDQREVAAEEADVDPGSRLEAIEVRLRAGIAVDRDLPRPWRPRRAGARGPPHRTSRPRRSRPGARRGARAPRPRERDGQLPCVARCSAACSTLPSTAFRCFSHAGGVPELEVVVAVRDDDLAVETGVARQGRRHEDAPRAIEVGLGGAGEEEPAGGRAPRATAGRAPRCGPRPSSSTSPADTRRRCRRARARGRPRRRARRETGPAA